MIEIVLLGKPVPKGRPRFNRQTGVAYTPAKTAKYETELKFVAAQVMGDRPPLEGPLALDMRVTVPIPQSWSKKKQADALSGKIMPTGKPDLDNLMKTVDSCNLIVWIDDSQLVDTILQKRYGEKPGLRLRVTPVQPPDEVFT